MDRDQQQLKILFDDLRRDDARGAPLFTVGERPWSSQPAKPTPWRLMIRYAAMATILSSVLALVIVALQSPSAPFAHLAWGLVPSDLDRSERILP